MNKIKQHWEDIFQANTDQQKSWYQSYPSTSIALIEDLHPDKNSAIIDVGGGDSRLVDGLLEKGYNNITVLDISSNAIENAKKRLGAIAKRVNWVVSDILNFEPAEQFDIWHDRAAFHFLIDDEEIKKYVEISERVIAPGGHLILGTFSEKGPQKCSGLEIKRYSQISMSTTFKKNFETIKCMDENHITPSKTRQNFTFCIFRKINN